MENGIERRYLLTDEIGGMALKAKKGEFGYLSRRKKRVIFWLVLLIGMAVAIYLSGLLLNKMSNRNVFTVISVLFALPIAKQFVALIVLFPYHSVSRESYQKATDHLPEGMELMTDLVITSSEHVMHLDFLAVGQNQVIGVLGEGKQQLSEVRAYLSKGVHNWGSEYKVKIVSSEKLFYQELRNVLPVEIDLEEEDRVRSYLLSIIV